MEFYTKILQKLKNNHKCYLLTVVENLGSSPGRQGFKMFVSDDGFISGSIGGGIMEYQFVEKVKKDLKADRLEVLFKRQVHQGKAKKDSSGMICSGEQTVVFHPLTKKDIPSIEKISHAIKNNIPSILVLSKNGISVVEQNQKNQFEFDNYNEWLFKEHLTFKEIFYIIGAGHVGLATSKIAHYLGFYVIIFDNRKELNTLLENHFVHKKHIVDYGDIKKHIKPNNFVAIMTSKFIDDKNILAQIINVKHRYLGVLGSKNKIKIMFNSLEKEGIDKEQLKAVFAPIGYAIKSQTPEEIAISIAAEVIQVKNNNKN